MKLNYDKDCMKTFHNPRIKPWISGFLKSKVPGAKFWISAMDSGFPLYYLNPSFRQYGVSGWYGYIA